MSKLTAGMCSVVIHGSFQLYLGAQAWKAYSILIICFSYQCVKSYFITLVKFTVFWI